MKLFRKKPPALPPVVILPQPMGYYGNAERQSAWRFHHKQQLKQPQYRPALVLYR